MFAADVDLDGRVDLLVSSSAGGYGAALVVEYSNANGSFTPVYADDSNINAGIPLTSWLVTSTMMTSKTLRP
jgi:hypothetical protein